MKHDHPSRKELEVLLAGLVEGVLPAAQKTRLGELLKDDAEARLFYKRYLEVHAMLDWESGTMASQETDSDETLQALAELARLHEEGLKQPFDPELHNKQRIHHAHAGQAQPLRLKTKLILTGSLAACIALAGLAVLIVNLFTGPEQPIAEQTDGTLAVATLTAERDARWGDTPAERALARGSSLHPNQTLTLTAGFAEITTNDGAIAIIEAPATIEFTHNNNALQLHAGKLVGICETESSKGFLVRTPHMDVTDLGTRFGVDATDTRTTEVHVFEGEVQALAIDADEAEVPMLLTAGESASTSSILNQVVKIEHEIEAFATLLPETTQLPGTGHGLAVGDTDPNWQIVAIDGKPLETPQRLSVNNGGYYIQHFANDPATSQWLAWNPREQTADEHTYLIRTTIQLPESVQQDTARLVLRYMADNELRSVRVNGQRVALPEVDITDMFTMFHEAVITEHLVPGQNTLVFELVNIRIEAGAGAAGFRIAWHLETPPPGTTR